MSDNYFIEIRDLVWQAANTIIWLDYPLWLCMYWFIKRTVKDYYHQNPLWAGNHYRLRALVWGKQPLLRWVWHTYRTRPRNYAAVFQQPGYSHLHLIRLNSPQQTEKWLTRLKT